VIEKFIRVENDNVRSHEHARVNVVPDSKALRMSVNFTFFFSKDSRISLEGAMSQFAYLETFRLNFSNSSFVIRVNLLHP